VKWLYGIGAVLLAAWFSPLGILWKDAGTWRYRLVLSVETPEGSREASSVGQASYHLERSINGGGMASHYAIRGEAVFLDLPGGRNLVMLLAHGITGDDVDGLAYVIRNRLLGRKSTDALAAEGARPVARVELTGQDIPTLVTFRDLNNPASAQVIRPQGLGAFGPGYALKEARLEMVSAGIWPFNLLPVPFPQALFGTPITTGIEGKLAFWANRSGKPWEQARKPNGQLLSEEERMLMISIFRGIKKDF
jgi:hypothetical protein